MKSCLDFCATFDRLPYFYITGGDPILHPDFWRLLEALHARDIPFAILGNPFHLDDAVCSRLRSLGCEKYQLSLDGLRETHDWFRKPGSFDCTLEKIPLIRRAGIKCAIMTTVSGANIDEVPELIDVAVAHWANIFAFARYCPTGVELDAGIAPLRYRALLETCDRKFREYRAAGCDTYFNKKDHLWTLYDYETGAFQIPPGTKPGMIYGGCNCGNCHLTILPSGALYACRRVQDSRVGSALDDRMADIWLNQMEAYREYGRFGKCARCELLAWCRGCPAVASGASGNFYDSDPPMLEGCGIMELMDAIRGRRSIRKYRSEQLPREVLERILEAGSWAANAGGGQRTMLVGIRDAALVARLGRMNLAKFDRSRLLGSFVSREQPSAIDDPAISNGFHGAPAVCAIFAQRDFLFGIPDAFCCAQAMALAAFDPDVASCIVARAEQTFDSPEGQALLCEWGVPESYAPRCFLALGYLDGTAPSPKPRRAGRICIVE